METELVKQNMYNIGFIGGGNMSTAIAKGILRNGKLFTRITVFQFVV